jgi:serine/threonine-protein kinase
VEEIEKVFANEEFLEPLKLRRRSVGNGNGKKHLSDATDVGDYEVLGKLGQGGMGVVYRARHRKLGRIVALKVIGQGAPTSEDTRKRFEREAATAAALDHPHIVPVYESGEEGGRLFIAMKLIEGESLETLRPPAKGRAAWAATLIEKVARAVQHAHERGVIHRDLKPANVLVSTQGEPHVADFGLARTLAEDERLTRSGIIVGTLAYMAPEQARGQDAGCDARSDVYGIGAILYQILVGLPPFRGASTAELLREVIEEDPISPAIESPGLPRDLVTICLRCLEKSPERRYPTAGDLADDLRRFLEGRPYRRAPVNRPRAIAQWARRRPATVAIGVLMCTSSV